MNTKKLAGKSHGSHLLQGNKSALPMQGSQFPKLYMLQVHIQLSLIHI